ncbi:MAG TPA: hypothetical protein VK050_06355 [Flavobacteriaceae bacterium]|nr:hypothetical protein [Flavobacteriaceae bacterium]
MYRLKTVKRTAGPSPGAAAPSKDLVLVKVDDVLHFPARDSKGVVVPGSFVMKEGAEMIEMYRTPGSQEDTYETEGDLDQEGITQSTQGNYPGDSVDILEFLQNNLGVGFVAITRRCDGGNNRMFGTQCSPVFLSSEYTSNSEGNMHTITLSQRIATTFVPAVYEGTFSFMEPTATDETIEATAGTTYKVDATMADEVITINTASLEAGDKITLIGGDVAGKLENTATVILAGGADWVGVPGASITLKAFESDSKILIETDRS